MKGNLVLLLLACAALLACSATGSGGPLTVGRDNTGGSSSSTEGSGGSLVFPSEPRTSEPLSAHIERPKGVTVDIITLSCSDQCADVEAVAKGGHAPYSFSWEDGSTSPFRRVCPSANTSYTVSVRDSGWDSREFRRDPETVTVPLTANVLDCPPPLDGGVGGDAMPPSGPLCIQNASFEGTAQVNPFVPFGTPNWNPCPSGVNAGLVTNESSTTPSSTYPAAADGSTYGVVSTNSGFGGTGILAQALCTPIEAAQTVSFTVALARIPYTGSPVTAMTQQVQVFGGTAECAESELLWTSPDLTAEFATFCVTLRPTSRVDSLSFRPLGDGNPLFNGLMSAAVDHVVPVAACP
jgi:hypothetical protein